MTRRRPQPLLGPAAGGTPSRRACRPTSRSGAANERTRKRPTLRCRAGSGQSSRARLLVTGRPDADLVLTGSPKVRRLPCLRRWRPRLLLCRLPHDPDARPQAAQIRRRLYARLAPFYGRLLGPDGPGRPLQAPHLEGAPAVHGSLLWQSWPDALLCGRSTSSYLTAAFVDEGPTEAARRNASASGRLMVPLPQHRLTRPVPVCLDLQIKSYIGTVIAAVVQVVALLSYLAAYCRSPFAFKRPLGPRAADQKTDASRCCLAHCSPWRPDDAQVLGPDGCPWGGLVVADLACSDWLCTICKGSNPSLSCRPRIRTTARALTTPDGAPDHYEPEGQAQRVASVCARRDVTSAGTWTWTARFRRRLHILLAPLSA